MTAVPHGAWVVVDGVPDPWARTEANYIAVALGKGKTVKVRAEFYPEIGAWLAKDHGNLRVYVTEVDRSIYLQLEEKKND